MTSDDIHESLIRSGRNAVIGQLTPAAIHELNNSLLVLLGMADLELAAGSAGSDRDEHLRIIRDAGVEIKEVVAALASFTRAPLEGQQPLVLQDVATSALALVRRVHLQRNVGLEESLGEEELIVQGNEAQLTQALVHLLANGFAAAKEHGKVTLELAREGDKAAVVVSDTGRGFDGIAPEDAFEPFASTRLDRYGGGIGLTAARAIGRAHGGDVELVRTGEGGTTLKLVLPLA